MALTFFLPAPPLPPLPLPKMVLFDLETSIAENQMFYLRNPVVTTNGTQGPMPRPLRKLPSAAGSKAPADNASFVFPTFASSAFSFPEQLTQFWGSMAETIVTTAMVFMVFCLPWLVIKRMNFLGKTEPALEAASEPIFTGFGKMVASIEPLDPLFEDLRLLISGRNQALAELRTISKQAREAEKKTWEREVEKEEALKRLRVGRDNTLAELAKEKENVAKVEEEKKKEVNVLREEISSQIKAWTEKEKRWEEEHADVKKRQKEAIDSLKMGRERESESWQTQVEGLEREKQGAKEAFGAELKNILERMKKERERWGKEKDAWKEEKNGAITEKEKMVREKEGTEEKRAEEQKRWDKANDRTQMRVAELERENEDLKDEAAEWEKKGKEVEAARKTAEEAISKEQKRGEEEAQEEAKKVTSKLEEEVLNGRKLIEDLQADKRRDRQTLFELRAQLVRPTHAAPPSHMNPLRFGGNASSFVGAPILTGPSSFYATGPPTFPSLPPSGPTLPTAPPHTFPRPAFHATGPPIFPSLPPSGPTPPTAPPLTFPRPTVRFPPSFPPNLTQLPEPTHPSPNAPQGPKSGPSNGPW